DRPGGEGPRAGCGRPPIRAADALRGRAPRSLPHRPSRRDRPRGGQSPPGVEVSDVIRIRDLAWRAGRDFAIRDLSMTVPAGAIYGFLGPNGSGKTTTIRLMLGMLPPADGTIEVLGHSVPRFAHRALARIGYVP